MKKKVIQSVIVLAVVAAVFVFFHFFTTPYIGLGITAAICTLSIIGVVLGIYQMRPKQ